jgi:hypothetical protein
MGMSALHIHENPSTDATNAGDIASANILAVATPWRNDFPWNVK